MADRMLMISWGQSVRGREERALEVFNESVGLWGRMQQDGRIESFDVHMLMPNGGMLGYAELKGSADQIAAAREDDEFMRSLTDASMIVDDLRVTPGLCNEGVAEQLGRFQEAVARVPQTA
jgi:hypothetical protein